MDEDGHTRDLSLVAATRQLLGWIRMATRGSRLARCARTWRTSAVCSPEASRAALFELRRAISSTPHAPSAPVGARS
eukprot:6554570-Alexandrium_andersonii.AAC.1